MNNTPVLYCVEPYDLAGHRLRVTLTLESPDPDGQLLSLPAWIPGSYLIRDFSRQIETLHARQGRRTLAVVKRDNHTWQLPPVQGVVTIEYVVYAWDLSVRGAHVDESHAFFNGTSVFLRVHGQEDQPCQVDLRAPTEHPDWHVYTSLPVSAESSAATQSSAARRHGFGRYYAPDYDALIDHPVEMGRPQTVSFEACGALHEMVFTGLAPNIDLARIARDVKRICEAQITFFEPDTLRAPFLDSADRYVFITQITANGYGGLEHRASTALMAARKDLPVIGDAPMDDGYRTFLGLVSHEYFHTWHVKRIKPAAFVPYDLTQPNLTRLLWVFEGFTSYYDDLFLLRAGVIDEPAYLRLLGKTMTQVARSPGRHKQSIAESSFDAWTRYYKQDENSPNALVSYYTKGALAALGLDLMIREATDGARSLDDVMQLLWTRFGRDFYRGAARGIPESAMASLIAEATGVDVGEAITSFVDGTDDVPLEALLARQGITINRTPASPSTTLDARLRKNAESLVFTHLTEHGAAHQGGLSAGDVLVAIDHLRVDSQAALDDILARRQVGAAIVAHVFRGDELREYHVVLAAAPEDYALNRIADTLL